MATVSSTISKMDIKNPEASSADQKLVERCLRGDDAAWEAIVSSFAGRIFRMSYRYTGRREEAEDLTQEIFIRIYQNLRSFRADTGSFQNWALRLSRNLIIDRYRQARRFQQCGGSQELDAMHLEDHSRPSPQRRMEQAEASVLIRRALQALSPESKEAIILRDLEGMGYQEMAVILGVPEGTVKSRISRGRTALARQLSKHMARGEVWV
jgi:RNA polymerase sigma-70 factor (ECF subfamily)